MATLFQVRLMADDEATTLLAQTTWAKYQSLIKEKLTDNQNIARTQWHAKENE